MGLTSFLSYLYFSRCSLSFSHHFEVTDITKGKKESRSWRYGLSVG